MSLEAVLILILIGVVVLGFDWTLKGQCDLSKQIEQLNRKLDK